MTWSLPQLLNRLHDDVEQRLTTAREALAHPTTMGDASQSVWLGLFNDYLPKRYSALTAHVADSKNAFSQQIDVLIVDRQYSPPIFSFQGQSVVPAESVYAAFEAKQTLNAQLVTYAQTKVESVRGLFRTSLPIPSASGPNPPKVLHEIIGGVLTLESEWSPPLGAPLSDALQRGPTRLDIGCIAAHGLFTRRDGAYELTIRPKAATAFLLELISRLQAIATAPMLDMREYAKWLPT